MLLLTSTSDIVRVVTGSAADVRVHTSYVDNASGTITPGRTNTPAITTATTTTIVGSPAASTQRNMRYLSMHNVSSTVTTTVNIEHFDGTTATPLFNATLLPDEHIHFAESQWLHSDRQGGIYTYQAPALPNLGQTGTLAETIPREICPEVNSTIGASGTLFLQAIYLVAGQLVSNITVWSATTAAATPTNGFFALYDGSRNLLANCANWTTEAWAANSAKTKAMTTPYRIPTSGLYYIGVLQVATTIATLKGGTAKTGGQLGGAVPILHGNSSTGLTTTLPNPAGAITAGTATVYAAVT